MTPLITHQHMILTSYYITPLISHRIILTSPSGNSIWMNIYGIINTNVINVQCVYKVRDPF